MAHPQVKNETPFAFELAAGLDEEGREVVATIVKATLELGPRGSLSLTDEQDPVNLGGEYWGDPPKHGFKFEPEGGFFKPTTDVALIGNASPARAGTASLEVTFRVGPVAKIVRVLGDRVWYQGATGQAATAPRPIEMVPLAYHLAYGGWDRSDPDPKNHDVEARNPIGVGFRKKGAALLEGSPLPNLEDPSLPLREYDGRSNPAGFGFTGPEWQPRAGFAGTYDAVWTKTRMPLLPSDFDRRFFNAASPGLITSRYLQGNEPVSVANVTGMGTASFSLPGFAPPVCHVRPLYGATQALTTNLDTVIVVADHRKVYLIWRAHLALQNGLHAVREVRVECANAKRVTRPRPALPENVIPLRP